MKTFSRGMKLLAFMVIVLALLTRGKGRITSIGSYSDDFPDVEFPDDWDECAGGSCSLYTEKRMMMPEKVVEHKQLMPRSYNSADAYTQWRPFCSCVAQHKLVNLGEGHYPRYITTAKCKTRTCSNKFYQCKYYEYRVHVLVQRGLSSILKNTEELDVRDVEELTLPESLHSNWQLFALSVPVACTAVERS